MKTPIEKLIEQLEEKISKAENFAKTQDELGLTMTLGVIAGFMESKLLAEKLNDKAKEI
jgi:hypothetical protein